MVETIEDPEPRAVVQRIGRWTYTVSVQHGLIQWGPNGGGWLVLGRKRAMRKASKVLARYRQRMERREDITAVYR